MTLIIKICGLSDESTIDAAIDAGADMIGLVLFPPSPRFVSLDKARRLADHARKRAEIVMLSVDMSTEELGIAIETVRPDWLQLHGHETIADIARLRQTFGLPIIKALAIGCPEDVSQIAAYGAAADRLLLDARPQQGAGLPGGNGEPFDWQLIDGLQAEQSYMLSGGLTPDNVGEAVRRTGAMGFDVSSGVELSPGRKDPGLIRAFIAALRNAEKTLATPVTRKAAS